MTVALYRSLPNTEIYVAYSDDNLVGPIEIPFWTPSVASISNQNSREARKNREKKKLYLSTTSWSTLSKPLSSKNDKILYLSILFYY